MKAIYLPTKKIAHDFKAGLNTSELRWKYRLKTHDIERAIRNYMNRNRKK